MSLYPGHLSSKCVRYVMAAAFLTSDGRIQDRFYGRDRMGCRRGVSTFLIHRIKKCQAGAGTE